MIKIFLLIFLISASPLLALRIDPDATSFAQKEKKRVDTFDFSGEYPNLRNIDIDGKRKICVELLLNGEYPLLEKMTYEGGFGSIKGELTGKFPLLREATITSKDATLNLDFRGSWSKECAIHIVGTKDIDLLLPQDVGIMVTITSSPFGKVYNHHASLNQRKRGIVQRIFLTPYVEGEERLLKINIVSDRGTVTLK